MQHLDWDARLMPVVEGLGYEYVGCETATQGRVMILRIFIDQPVQAASAGNPGQRQGVTLEDCQTISQHLSRFFDVEDILPPYCHLEVSSPGLDRLLKRPAHFSRFLGKKVRVRLLASFALDEGRRQLTGCIKAVSEACFSLETQEGVLFDLQFDQIEKANLVPEW
jgi:ribosome maturation factor RimP